MLKKIIIAGIVLFVMAMFGIAGFVVYAIATADQEASQTKLIADTNTIYWSRSIF